MSDDNVIQFRTDFPKTAQIPALTAHEVAHLTEVAYARMAKPVMGCLLLFWDENGVMSVSDNRGNLFTAEQLQWLTYGVAHMKGRGIVQPVPVGGNVTPLVPPEGA